VLHLGSIGKTSIDVDFSFFILLFVFVAYGYDPQQPIQYALIWIPVVFISVLFHELAHAAMIALLGFGASHIVLGGMGGVTMNSRKARPWQDLLISVAGPFTNFVMMFICYLLLSRVALVRQDRMLVVLVPLLISANAWWGIFNLVPVPPLDGGHATREFFRIFLSERNAFVIAIWIAMVVGTGVVLFALKFRAFFVALYLGWFVYVAWQQWQYFRQHGVPGD
jgi:Zn-dependent protease